MDLARDKFKRLLDEMLVCFDTLNLLLVFLLNICVIYIIYNNNFKQYQSEIKKYCKSYKFQYKFEHWVDVKWLFVWFSHPCTLITNYWKAFIYSELINEWGVRIHVAGRLSMLPEDLRSLVAKAMLATKNNNILQLNIAYAYTGMFNYYYFIYTYFFIYYIIYFTWFIYI